MARLTGNNVRLRKHINNTDVAIEILKSFTVPEKEILKLRVAWWNIGECHAPYPLGVEQKVEIKFADWPNWKPYVWLGVPREIRLRR